jgi:hypothetical protein
MASRSIRLTLPNAFQRTFRLDRGCHSDFYTAAGFVFHDVTVVPVENIRTIGKILTPNQMIHEYWAGHLPFPVGDDVDLRKTAEDFRFDRFSTNSSCSIEADGGFSIPAQVKDGTTAVVPSACFLEC